MTITEKDKNQGRAANLDSILARDAARIIHADPDNKDSSFVQTLIRIKKLMGARTEDQVITDMEKARNSCALPYSDKFVQNRINTMKRRRAASDETVKEFGGIQKQTAPHILDEERAIVASGMQQAARTLALPNRRSTTIPYLALELAEYDTARLSSQIEAYTGIPVHVSVSDADETAEMINYTTREKVAYMDAKIWYITNLAPIVTVTRERLDIDSETDTDSGMDSDIETQQDEDQEIDHDKYPDTS